MNWCLTLYIEPNVELKMLSVRSLHKVLFRLQNSFSNEREEEPKVQKVFKINFRRPFYSSYVHSLLYLLHCEMSFWDSQNMGP